MDVVCACCLWTEAPNTSPSSKQGMPYSLGDRVSQQLVVLKCWAPRAGHSRELTDGAGLAGGLLEVRKVNLQVKLASLPAGAESGLASKFTVVAGRG